MRCDVMEVAAAVLETENAFNEGRTLMRMYHVGC